MGKYFGTDGFRGVANESLTAIHAFRVGRFLGRYFARGKSGRTRILVGKDTRRSSYTLEYSLAAGATASGADVYLLHVTTTPSVSYLTRTEGFDCGVMISASHNTFADNGIKLFNGEGEKLEDGVIAILENYLDGGTVPLATGAEVGCTVDYVAGRNRYLAYLLALPCVGFRGMRVGLDCANGSAFMIAKAVFDALGAKTYTVGTMPDGLNINAGCGSTHPEVLNRLVVAESLDVGFAFDGDADRCIVIDERGRVLDGDAVLYLAAKGLKARGELDGDGIVATKMSNSGLSRSLLREGIRVDYAEVGDRFVYEEMVRRGYLLGGESSGHIIFRKYSQAGDGILTALKVLEMALEARCPVSLLAEGYVPLPQVRRAVHVKKRERAMEAEGVLIAKERAEVLCDRVLLRASGTEPVVRILTEGEDERACAEAADLLERALRSAEESI
ncbi:MAG: phosphoglucosamine mutase [Clostridia bacterium]|nr:phosphoglucosamine mutase [Clostridia bacterium]